MSTTLIQINLPPGEPPFALTPAQAKVRQMVLDSVQSIHSKRNYAKALDDLFAFRRHEPGTGRKVFWLAVHLPWTNLGREFLDQTEWLLVSTCLSSHYIFTWYTALRGGRYFVAVPPQKPVEAELPRAQQSQRETCTDVQNNQFAVLRLQTLS